jgi:hypothetical protein
MTGENQPSHPNGSSRSIASTLATAPPAAWSPRSRLAQQLGG